MSLPACLNFVSTGKLVRDADNLARVGLAGETALAAGSATAHDRPRVKGRSVRVKAMVSPQVLDTLSMNEIIRRHPKTFLLLDRCKFDERGRVKLARVLKSTRGCNSLYPGLREHPNSVIIYAGADHQEHEGAFLDSGQSFAANRPGI